MRLAGLAFPLLSSRRTASCRMRSCRLGDRVDENGWQCCICKDGSGFCPTDPLGICVLTRDLPDGFFSATNFNRTFAVAL
jgi:hypothetical protein